VEAEVDDGGGDGARVEVDDGEDRPSEVEEEGCEEGEGSWWEEANETVLVAGEEGVVILCLLCSVD